MKKYFTLLLTTGLLLICASTFAAPRAANEHKLQKFIEHLESEKKNLHGGAAAILYKNQVIYKTTFGKQRGNSKPIKSNTLFPLASVSKPVSAMAIALMVEDGSVSLNERVKLPYLVNPVSLNNILSHTTGYPFSGNPQIERGMPRQTILQKLKYEKPKCQPGQCYSYSNATYSLVEEVLNVRKLTLQSAIFNLRKTLKTNGIQLVPLNPNLEVAYPHLKDKPLRFPPYYPKAAPAAAGVFASLDGMIEFYKLSFGYRPDLISKNTLQKFHKPMISNRDVYKWQAEMPFNRSNIESYYGLGWRILRAKQRPGKDLIFHPGYINGANTFIGYIPSEEIGMIMLANQNTKVPMQSGMKLWGLYVK
ncbi:MAG: serine hydrolase domain-containing protein [Gammaproteobacteria bacterium]